VFYNAIRLSEMMFVFKLVLCITTFIKGTIVLDQETTAFFDGVYSGFTAEWMESVEIYLGGIQVGEPIKTEVREELLKIAQIIHKDYASEDQEGLGEKVRKELKDWRLTHNPVESPDYLKVERTLHSHAWWLFRGWDNQDSHRDSTLFTKLTSPVDDIANPRLFHFLVELIDSWIESGDRNYYSKAVTAVNTHVPQISQKAILKVLEIMKSNTSIFNS
jgi:hypothetical protein